MRIAIFSENLLGNSGGAEIYALKLAEALYKDNDVEIFTARSDKTDVELVYKKYNVPFFETTQIKKKHSNFRLKDIFYRIIFWNRLKAKINGKYDFYINASCNRMIGFNRTKSIHLIHFPVQAYSKILRNKIGFILDNKYRNSYTQFWVNSKFTGKYLKIYWNLDAIIVNPPIDMQLISQTEFLKKENTILIVGRIVPDKKIKEMIMAFLEIKSKLSKYNLVVVGNKDTNCLEYYNELKKIEEQNRSIRILADISYDDLVTEYKKAKIFWHAKGLGVDSANPLLMEHFGMTTVEAMANGCLPIVINKAGQREIIENGKFGFLWNNIDELQKQTLMVANNEIVLDRIAKNAMIQSENFLFPYFSKKIKQLIK